MVEEKKESSTISGSTLACHIYFSILFKAPSPNGAVHNIKQHIKNKKKEGFNNEIRYKEYKQTHSNG